MLIEFSIHSECGGSEWEGDIERVKKFHEQFNLFNAKMIYCNLHKFYLETFFS